MYRAIHSQIGITLCALLALLPQAASAAGLSYNFFEVSYIETQLDATPGRINGDGLALAASIVVDQTLAFVIEHEDVDYAPDINVTKLYLGLDFHKPNSPTGDVYFGFGLLEVELAAPGIAEHDTGKAFSLGLRSKGSDTTEIYLELTRTDVGNRSDNGYAFGAVLFSNQRISYKLVYRASDDDTSTLLGIRSIF